jgi:hypothetical protein
MRVLKRATLFTALVILMSACNQLDTVLPSIGTYRVNALVNHSSLDECSVITADDTILPYFSSSVAGDPDLANLVVYLEDSGGKPVGNRVRYTTEPVPAAETTTENTVDASKTDTPATEGSPGLEKPLETAESPSESGVPKSGDETAAVPAGTVTDPSTAHSLVIPVNNFTGQLPPFPLAGDIEIGYYTMVFEIRGKQELLGRAERQILYTGDQEFSSGGIRYYLPGVYGNRHLVPQDLNVMLETQVNYGEDLSPYIVWYNGSRRIGEGFVSDGVARILWKASRQTGFHTIRAELFPLEPQKAAKGIVQELSLPVSSQVEETPPLAARSNEFLYQYQLSGDLRETGTGAELSREHTGTGTPLWYPAAQIYGLALKNGDSYEASPRVLDLTAISAGDKTGLLRFFVHFFPLSEGTILSAMLGYGPNAVTLRLFLAENALYLEAEGGGGRILSDPMEIDGAYASFMGLALDVEIRKTGLSLSFVPADSSLLPQVPPETGVPATASPETGVPAPPARQEMGEAPSRGLELELNNLPQGELRSWLGTPPGTEEQTVENLDGPASTLKKAPPVPAPVAVIDDFSALFRLSPVGDNDEAPAQTAAADNTGLN